MRRQPAARPIPRTGPAPRRGRRLEGGLVAVLALVLLASLPAWAQQNPLEKEPTRDKPFPVLENPRRLGFLRLVPGFEVRNLGYDDNIFTSPQNKTSDYTGEAIASAVSQVRLGHRSTLTGRLALGAEVFLHNRDQTNLNNSTQFRADTLLGQFLLSVRGEYDFRRLPPGSELDLRPERRRRRERLEARWFVSPSTDLTVGQRWTTYRYKDPDFDTLDELLNREESTTSLRFRWKALPRTRLTAEAQRRDYRFDDPRLERNAEDRRYALGAMTEGIRTLGGRVELGHVDFQPDRPGKPAYQGLYGESRIVYRFLQRMEAIAGYERDLHFSTFRNILYYIYNQRSIELRIRLRRSWTILGGFDYARTRYPTEIIVRERDGIERGMIRRDKITVPFVGLQFELWGAWTVDLRVGVREQESNYELANDRQFFVRNGLRRRF